MQEEQQAEQSLDATLQERVRSTGTLSSADVAAAGQAVEEAPAPVEGAVETELAAKDFDDPLTTPVREVEEGAALANAIGEPLDSDNIVDIEIDAEDRDAFLDALVEGKRLVRRFSLFGGKVTGMLRARTQAETRAIIAQLQREIREKSILVDADYTLRLRSMLMAAQLQEYQDTENPELITPLVAQRQPDGVEAPVGWLEQSQSWENLDEGIASALYEEIRQFELKYWTMVRHAADQDFWRPVAST